MPLAHQPPCESSLNRHLFRDVLIPVVAILLAMPVHARTYEVGPGKDYKSLSSLADSRRLRSGDVIEVDSAGEYCGDVAMWKVNNLTIRGVGAGRAHLKACGKSARNKGIWVVHGRNFTAENIEFSGAKVRSRNGAGIRLQNSGSVTIRNCHFHDNQNGILGGGKGSTVLIENSIFERNGSGDGSTHNVYISHRVDKLVFQHNYSHGARVGHNLKSRARENYVLYNRIMDEHEGNASFQVDLPMGGKSYLIGNVIQQGPNAENFSLVAYANETKKLAHPIQELYVVNNTFVNTRTQGGRFIKIKGIEGTPTHAVIRNNLFWGTGDMWASREDVSVVEDHNLVEPDLDSNPGFQNPQTFDYRLATGSRAIEGGTTPGEGGGYDLTPALQYVRDARQDAREAQGTIDIGAFEFPGE